MSLESIHALQPSATLGDRFILDQTLAVLLISDYSPLSVWYRKPICWIFSIVVPVAKFTLYSRALLPTYKKYLTNVPRWSTPVLLWASWPTYASGPITITTNACIRTVHEIICDGDETVDDDPRFNRYARFNDDTLTEVCLWLRSQPTCGQHSLSINLFASGYSYRCPPLNHRLILTGPRWFSHKIIEPLIRFALPVCLDWY